MNATCTAVFDFDTDPSPTPAGQTVLVAFPVTGFSGKAVKISEFEVTIDGTRRPDIQKRGILLVSKKGDEGRILEEGWFPIDANPIVSEYMGYQITWGEPTTSSFLHAYVWTQEFLPGKHCRVEVRYLLTLHAQSLAYSKKYTKGEGQEVVPFDAMVAGESGDKAFFLDYILRSGATWKGPIGHETVTLRAAPSSGLTLERGDVITFGRNIFSVAPYTADSMNRLRAGVTAVGIDWKSKDIVWEIDREKPNEDILMEIPFSAVRSTSNARKP